MLQTPMANNIPNEYTPDEVSAPGETLQEILAERQMSQTELAGRLGLAHKTVNEIIRGKAPLTHETALGLETVLGIPARFWNEYERAYRESLTRKDVAERLSDNREWVESFPLKEAAKLKWIRLSTSTPEQTMETLRFFGVASPTQYQEVYGGLEIQWKRSENLPVDPHATAFWLRRGEIQAAALSGDPRLEWHDYDQREFERRLAQIRALTSDRDPETFVPELQRLCALAGVAVVFVPELKGTRAAGAARWLSPGRALIQLSLRYKFNDSLWFAFFHEAGHILKHSKKRLFLELTDGNKDEQEREANQFAQNMLIPPRDYVAFTQTGKPTKASVEEFAHRIGVDPGIVVGRLQNDRIIPRHYFNDLKQRYSW